MKKFAALSVALSLIAPHASAATPSVAVKKLDRLVAAPSAEGLAISGKTLVTYSNSTGANANIVVTGFDLNGNQLWQKIIDSGVDEIATSITSDASGTIWIAGSSAQTVTPDTATAPVVTDNPDGVAIEAKQNLRGDLNQISLWKLSQSGDLLSAFNSAQSKPVLITGFSINSTGASIIGVIGDKPFVITTDNNGKFSPLLTIGTSKTTFNSVVRSADGSSSIFGASSETLGGKKNSGVIDGILLKTSKKNSLSTVVRSSAPKAKRAWLSASQTLALTGSVITGSKVESAFTQFTSTFSPTWTLRIPSDGNSLIASAGNTYGVIGSRSAIAGISGWKPSATSLLLIAFNSKGVISAAYGASELASPLALVASKDVGVYGLASSSDGSVSIFHLGTR